MKIRNKELNEMRRLYRQVEIEVIGKKLRRMKPLTSKWLELVAFYHQLTYDNAKDQLTCKTN